jgi:hypothetical protein
MQQTSKPPESSLRSQLAAVQAAVLVTGLFWATSAHAYLGEKALKWAVANITMPMGLIAIVVALVSAKFNPKMAGGAAMVAIICLVVGFLTSQGNQVIQVLQP